MFGYTGTYKGKEVSVMGSGMGIPSIGIYSYELYNFFDVDTIIRVGSCGALQENVNLYDVIIAQAASTNSNYVDQFNIPGHFAPIADYELITKAKNVADEIGAVSHVGNVYLQIHSTMLIKHSMIIGKNGYIGYRNGISRFILECN